MKYVIVLFLILAACTTPEKKAKPYAYTQELEYYLTESKLRSQLFESHSEALLLFVPDYDCTPCLMEQIDFILKNLSEKENFHPICTAKGEAFKKLQKEGFSPLVESKLAKYRLNMGPGLILRISKSKGVLTWSNLGSEFQSELLKTLQ
jgi:hypothetical protein